MDNDFNQYLGRKHYLQIAGKLDATETLVFAHGYGSNQAAWRFITPAFADRYRLVLFDMVGCGNSDIGAFDPNYYRSLHNYADDLIAICDSLRLRHVHLITHSVSGIVGTLAALNRPDLFANLVFIGVSPRYLNDEGYEGGFTQEQVVSLLLEMGNDYMAWLGEFAPKVMDAPEQPELVQEFADSLAQMGLGNSIAIARKVFFCDHRADVERLQLPVLIIQARSDVVVPSSVGEYLHRAIANSVLHWISTPGHFPHMTNPSEIIQAIQQHLERVAALS